MKFLGWRPHAQDVYESACGLAHRYGIPVTIGDVKDLPSNLSQDFDVITAWHVLEHMLNPRKFAKASYALLKSGGEVVLEVPHLNAAERLLLDSKWWLWMPPIHVNHFSIESIRALLQGAGFIDIRCKTYGSHFSQSSRFRSPMLKRTIYAGLALVQQWTNRGSLLWVSALKP